MTERRLPTAACRPARLPRWRPVVDSKHGDHRERRDEIVKAVVTLFLCALVAWCVVAVALPVSALAEADVDLAQVLNGEVPGLTGQVTGTGVTYYGDALRARFQNTTGQTLTVAIPLGMRLVPQDPGVQTMYTAGGEVVTVPPGASNVVFKAFCGEAHDSAPGGEDVFSPDGFADGDLLETLERINRENAFDSDGQLAVWHQTDGYDTADNPRASDLASGDSVPSSRAAAAGLLGAAAAGGSAALLARKRGVGTPAQPPPPPEPPPPPPPGIRPWPPAEMPAGPPDYPPAGPQAETPPAGPPGKVTAEEPFDPADFPDVDYGTMEPGAEDLIAPADLIVEPPPPDEDLLPPVEEEPPPSTDATAPARDVTAPPSESPGPAPPPVEGPAPPADDAEKATGLVDQVLDWLRNLGPPEEPDPDRLPDETVEKIANVFGAEGGLRSAQREAEYPGASTDPDKQRRMQQEIAEETLQQVDAEDWLGRLRVIRALMVTAWTTVSERGELLFRLGEGAISGGYDKGLPDYTELGPQAMLSQRGLKGLYNDYRDTYTWTESLTARTPRDRQEVFDELKKAAEERVQMELDWPADSPDSFYDDPDYQRVQRRLDILHSMDRAFDYQPRPKLNLD